MYAEAMWKWDENYIVTENIEQNSTHKSKTFCALAPL